MRIIDTGITQEILSMDNHPQIRIAGKDYVVDDRQKTFDKMQEIQADRTLSETERTKKIYNLALGETATNDILNLDLTVDQNRHLSFCIMGAITGQDPKVLEAAAEKQMGKN